MGKHTYSLTVLVCTLSTGVEGIQQWIAQDNSREHPLTATR
jgi:hypothetical protein